MIKTGSFKALSFLLLYPTEEILRILPEVFPVLVDGDNFSKDTLKKLEDLIFHLEKTDVFTLQEQYVTLFDRTPSNSLHLFEHVFGDSRERGSAMVDLASVYESKGMIINNNELPDYLPLFLEYLSLLSLNDSLELLGESITIIASLGIRLNRIKSKYAAVFDALVEVSIEKPEQAKLDKVIAEAGKYTHLDDSWQEPQAFSKQF